MFSWIEACLPSTFTSAFTNGQNVKGKVIFMRWAKVKLTYFSYFSFFLFLKLNYFLICTGAYCLISMVRMFLMNLVVLSITHRHSAYWDYAWYKNRLNLEFISRLSLLLANTAMVACTSYLQCRFLEHVLKLDWVCARLSATTRYPANSYVFNVSVRNTTKSVKSVQN